MIQVRLRVEGRPILESVEDPTRTIAARLQALWIAPSRVATLWAQGHSARRVGGIHLSQTWHEVAEHLHQQGEWEEGEIVTVGIILQ